jgi:hypothetical protein
MPSKKSGGARATERKRRAQEAVRPKGYNARAIAKLKRRMKPSDGSIQGVLGKAVLALEATLDEAAGDPGVPPEYRREQMARIAAALAKAAEPKKLIDDLAADLRAAHAVIEALKEQHHAAEESPANPGRPSADPH